jgi:hypothetical protein
MRIGRGAAHGFRTGRGRRGAGLSGGRGVGCWGRRMGERTESGRLWRRRHGGRKTGMAAGVKPRSREAVRPLAQGFTRDDSPGENERWRRIL